MIELTFEEGRDYAKAHLLKFMEKEGIRVFSNGAFSCPNKGAHRHGDAKPSASIMTHGALPAWQCHGCGSRGDTIDMAILLDPSLPEKGTGFRMTTLPYVLERLDAKLIEGENATPDFATQCAIQAKDYIKKHMAKPIDLAGSDFGRGYTEEFAAAMLKSYPIARTSEPAFKNPILHPTTDGYDILLIPIIADGMYVGTVARHCQKTLETRQDLQKYKNSLQVPEQNINYMRILNMDRGIREGRRAKKLFIIEGVFNTLAAMAAGIYNVVGILGIKGLEQALTGIIGATEIREVCFVSDKDVHGSTASINLARALAKIGVVSRYYAYDQDSKLDYDQEFNKDPDGFGAKIINPVNSISIIEYIALYRGDYMAEEKYSDSTKFEMLMSDVALYGNLMESKLYARAIQAAFPSFGADVKDITIRIKEVLKNKNSPLLHQLNDLSERATVDVRNAKTVEGKVAVIEQLGVSVKNINVNLRVNIRDAAKKRMANTMVTLQTDYSKAFPTGYANIDNFPKDQGGLYFAPNNLIGLMGKGSHAKSTLSRGIFSYLLSHHENILPVYFTLDDSYETTLNYLISTMAMVAYRDLELPNENVEKLKRKLIENVGERYYIFDHREINGMSAAAKTYRSICDDNPDKTVLVFCDNMYNLPEIARNKDNVQAKRAATEEWIDICRTDVKDFNLTICNTLEVKKTQGRLNDNDVKDTGAVDYRSNFMLSTYNSFRELKERSKMIKGTAENGRPIIEVMVHKAKTGKPGVIYFFELEGPTQTLYPIIESAEISHWMTMRASEISAASTAGRSIPQAAGSVHPSPDSASPSEIQKPAIKPQMI